MGRTNIRPFWLAAQAVVMATFLSLWSSSVAAQVPQDDLKSKLCPKMDATTACFELARKVLPSASGVKLYNGYLVKPDDWRALAMAKFYFGKDDLGRDVFATCTATLVGPRAVLTAAHCVDMGKKTEFRTAYLLIGSKKVTMTCDPDPRYFEADYIGQSPRSSYDFALCELSWSGLEPPALVGMVYETLDATNVLAANDKVLLTGYGCTGLEVVNRVLIWTHDVTSFRIGEEAVEKPVNTEIKSPAYLRTRSSGGREAALCPGDSGGPLMSGLTLNPSTEPNGPASLVTITPRRVRGVNSSIDFDRDQAGAPYDYLSRISALAGTGFDGYATWWLRRHRAASICGLLDKATSCQK